MANYSTFHTSNTEVRDPVLKGLVNNLTDIMKASVSQSLYHRTNGIAFNYKKHKIGVAQIKEYASVGEVVDQWMATKKPAQIENLRGIVGRNSFSSTDPLFISNLRALNIRSPKYMIEQVNIPNTFGYLNENLLASRFPNLLGISDAVASVSVGQQPVRTAELNLSRVKCEDETNPEWAGKDEIAAGGVVVDDKNVETKITQFSVASFNDGGVKSYTPVKVLKSFRLDQTNPSTFFAFFALSEKDSGGFGDFLSELYQAVKGELTKIVTAVGAAAGGTLVTVIGGSIGTAIAGPIGTVIGIVAGLALGALIGWLCDAFGDEIFEPQVIGITINENVPFIGPKQRLTFRDFDGTYTADLFWSVR